MRKQDLVRTASVVATLAVVALGAAMARNDRGSPTGLATGRDAGAAFRVPPPSPPTTTAPPTTTVPIIEAPALPLPEPIPLDAYAPTPEKVIGRLRIPKFDVDEPLGEGITLTSLNRGPGWWPGTALPGQLGNLVVGGHRTTYSKPFSRIDELVEGDEVIFAMPDRDYVYQVRGVIVVPEDRIGIAGQTYNHVATLFACHPKGSATHRVVAKLRLLNPDGTPVDKDDWLPPVDYGHDITTLVVNGGLAGTPTEPAPALPANPTATTTTTVASLSVQSTSS